jgi:hypothetical protein
VEILSLDFPFTIGSNLPVIFSSGSGVGATGTINSALGDIDSISFTSRGSGYAIDDIIRVEEVGGNGIGNFRIVTNL